MFDRRFTVELKTYMFDNMVGGEPFSPSKYSSEQPGSFIHTVITRFEFFFHVGVAFRHRKSPRADSLNVLEERLTGVPLLASPLFGGNSHAKPSSDLARTPNRFVRDRVASRVLLLELAKIWVQMTETTCKATSNNELRPVRSSHCSPADLQAVFAPRSRRVSLTIRLEVDRARPMKARGAPRTDRVGIRLEP